jgi:hypothetical protein
MSRKVDECKPLHYGAEVYREWGLTALERELDAGGALAVSGRAC